jgi:hypothetical protein
MSNLLAQTINCDDADLAAEIVPITSPNNGQPTVSSVRPLSVNGSEQKPVISALTEPLASHSPLTFRQAKQKSVLVQREEPSCSYARIGRAPYPRGSSSRQ